MLSGADRFRHRSAKQTVVMRPTVRTTPSANTSKNAPNAGETMAFLSLFLLEPHAAAGADKLLLYIGRTLSELKNQAEGDHPARKRFKIHDSRLDWNRTRLLLLLLAHSTPAAAEGSEQGGGERQTKTSCRTSESVQDSCNILNEGTCPLDYAAC